MAKNGTYKLSVENRVSTLEANHQELKDDINEIKTNHLEHLSSDIKELKNDVQAIKIQIARWGGAILVIIPIGQIIIDKLFK